MAPEMKRHVGQPLLRREDMRHLTGRGSFVDDIALADTAHVVFLRSPHAHARIVSISLVCARAMPGVLAVVSAAEWAAAGLGELVCVHPMPFTDGRRMNEVLRPAFARTRVCHVGDVVAAIAATSLAAAVYTAVPLAAPSEMLAAAPELKLGATSDTETVTALLLLSVPSEATTLKL